MFHRLLSRFVRCCVGGAFFSLVVGAAAQSPAPGQFNLYAPATPPPQPLVSATPPTTAYQPPKVLKPGAVTYPILANLNRVEGVVGVRFAIDESGKVKDATVYRTSRSMLLDAVVKSRGIMDWTFQPATLNGKPVPSTMDKEIEFHLDPAEQRQFALKRLAAPIGTPDPPYPAEALAITPHPRGDCKVGVYWTTTGSGLVDIINLLESSGSATLDHAALRFAYENWHIDPKQIKDPKQEYTKVLTFTPPGAAATPPASAATGTPPPLAAATPTPTPAATATPKPKRGH